MEKDRSARLTENLDANEILKRIPNSYQNDPFIELGFFDNKESALNACHPKLKKIVENVGSIKEIQDWVKNRPETPF